MKFHPILFSTEMVKAILEGRKTQTRRVVKGTALEWLQPNMFTPEFVSNDENNLSPYGYTGDVLWVREKFHNLTNCETGEVIDYAYYADMPDEFHQQYPHKHKPSIHMPKTACRIFLQIKSIRVERLQDITEEDAKAEGVRYPVTESDTPGKVIVAFRLSGEKNAIEFMPDGWMDMSEKEKSKHLMCAHFAELWCDINGPESWQANPFVWVIEFQRIERPQNFLS